MLAQHSSSELALLQAAFRHASRGESQRVEAGAELSSPAQLRRALKDLALELADEDCHVLFAYMDRNKSGSVDWIEFAAVMLLPLTGLTDPDLPPGGHVSEEEMLDESAKRLFKVLDADGDGIVSLDEFQTVMTKVFPSWCPDNLTPVFQEIDAGSSGNICFAELQAFVRKQARQSGAAEHH